MISVNEEIYTHLKYHIRKKSYVVITDIREKINTSIFFPVMENLEFDNLIEDKVNKETLLNDFCKERNIF